MVILTGGLGEYLKRQKNSQTNGKIGNLPIIHHIIKIYGHMDVKILVFGGYKYKFIQIF